jgi:DNA-binding transcriptional ArsR family regulator
MERTPSTDPAPRLAALARLLADDTRAAFCLALLDGRAWTASELASHAGVSAPTATEHLHRLVAGGLLVQRRQGRHRYVQLADERVAQLLEELTAAVGPVPPATGSLRTVTASAALARGRTCYDHLAGRLGVRITDAMTAEGLLDQSAGCAITSTGLDWLTGALGVDPGRLRTGRRPLARACLDWTERRTHLAGAAGAQLCTRLFELGWVRRVGSGRAVLVTPEGGRGLHDLLGISAG